MDTKPVKALSSSQSAQPEKPLNIQFIQEKLVAGFPYTKQAKDQDLVLLIGNSGVGKSTTGNYIFDPANMEEKEITCKLNNGLEGSIYVVETKKPAFLPIGHNVKSETLYANPVRSGTFNWCLTDCPGFLGNRTVEERVIESISTELAIRHARQVKGIIVLISMESIKESRLFELLALVKSLVTLFKNPAEMVEHTVFGITKAEGTEERDRKTVLFKLNQLITLCDEKINQLGESGEKDTSGLEAIDYEHIKAYFTAVLKKQDKILFIRPLDGGVSRQRLIDQINGIKPREGLWGVTVSALSKAKNFLMPSSGSGINPITIEDFNFSNYDEYRQKFNRAMYNIAHKGSVQIQRIKACSQNIIHLHKDISQCKQDIEHFNSLMTVLSDKTFFGDANEKNADEKGKAASKAIWSQLLLTNNQKMKDNKELIPKLKQELEAKEKSKAEINTDDLIVFREFDKQEKTGWIWKSSVEYQFEADTGDSQIPIYIAAEDKTCQNGKFYDEDDQCKKGYYKVTYKSERWANPAGMHIVVKYRQKDEPGNKLKIPALEKEISDLKAQIEKLGLEVGELEKTNQTLETDIAQVDAQSLKTEQQRTAKVNEAKESIAKLQKRIADNNVLLSDFKKDGAKWVKEFSENNKHYTMLSDLSQILTFPVLMVKEFAQDFKQFNQELESCAKCFFDGSHVLSDSLDNRDKSDESQGSWVDPVNVVYEDKSYIFERSTLMKYFGSSPVIGSVYKHKFTNGTEIEIKYPEWTNYASPLMSPSPIPSPSPVRLLDTMSKEHLIINKQEVERTIKDLQNQMQKKMVELELIDQELITRFPDVNQDVEAKNVPMQFSSPVSQPAQSDNNRNITDSSPSDSIEKSLQL